MKTELPQDSPVCFHDFSVADESIAWSSCSSAGLASSSIHGAKLTLSLESTSFRLHNVALRFGIYMYPTGPSAPSPIRVQPDGSHPTKPKQKQVPSRPGAMPQHPPSRPSRVFDGSDAPRPAAMRGCRHHSQRGRFIRFRA